ncbi:MAG: NUDIX hydrolase [Ignavibacteriaceae bacterium]|nr:NUDIX hydrolase [Ignavibacteriaceae bacterium]
MSGEEKITFNFDQSAVVPFRRIDGLIQVLLITSLRKKKWIVPKGYVEFNLHPFESAKKEAYEEAGVTGTNETIELGFYKKEKSAGVVSVRVYSMEVLKVLEEFPEKKLRKRKWFSVEEAITTIEVPEIVEMIKNLPHKIK